MTTILRSGTTLLASLAIGAAASTHVAAQDCSTGCGPRVGNSCATRVSDCGHGGMKQYPLSEKHYIKQFCGPHIVAGSCFGYFKPQITRWGQACPNYVGEPESVGTVVYTPIAQPAQAAEPVKETPKSTPLAAPKVDAPKVEPIKPMPTIPTIPKIEEVPGKPPTSPIVPGKLPAAPNAPAIPKVEVPPLILPAVQIPPELPNTSAGRF